MFDDNLLRENFKKILEIKKVFENAKKDEGKTFLDKINNLDKSILQEQLDFYGNKTEKVKKIRYNIIKSILDGIKVSNNDIETFKDNEKNNFQGKDIFRSWKNFSILYSIYYFDKKDFVNDFLLDLNTQLIKDLGISDLVKINIVDFQGAQNFGLDNFWTAIYNKSHKSQRNALQLNIVSSGEDFLKFNDNEIAIGIGSGPDVKKEINNHKKIKIDNITYDFILTELSKYKNDIINDNYIKKEKVINKPSFWLYSPGKNASKWEEFYDKGIMGIGWDELGNLEKYSNQGEIKEKISLITEKQNPYNDTLACEDFVRNIKIGDIIIAKEGRKKYLGYGIVDGNYEFDNNKNEFKSIRKIKWVKKGIWEEEGDVVLKTLTNIDNYKDYVEKLKILLGINSPNNNTMPKSDKTSQLLDNKKQIILYGPPGTGKTYNIKNIIENHSGESYSDLKNDGRVEFITFHQSFSYEEFIEGIKPDLSGDSEEISYKIEDGVFKKVSINALFDDLVFENFQEDLNYTELYDILIDEFKKNNSLLLKSKDNKKIIIKSISDRNSLHCYHENSNVKHTVGKDRLKRIYDKYNSIESLQNLSNMQEEFTNIIGGANQTVYWTVLNKILIYKEELKKENIDTNITYEKKKELIRNNIKNEYKNNKNYYLVIDEINRGNISKIFGELITLLEADKRLGEKNEITTKLPYSKEDFGIPSNLYIVSTMNTSDKSIVSLDTALRRRFGFKEMLPDYTLEGLNKDIEGIHLSKLLEKINNRIEYLIDKDHLIGHSYLLKTTTVSDLKLVVYNEILPLLEEYFYGEEEKIRQILGNKLFEKKKIDERLFENKGDFENDDNQYEINKDLNNQDFINALKNIIKSDEEN